LEVASLLLFIICATGFLMSEAAAASFKRQSPATLLHNMVKRLSAVTTLADQKV
jgi:hypothetical protein